MGALGTILGPGFVSARRLFSAAASPHEPNARLLTLSARRRAPDERDLASPSGSEDAEALRRGTLKALLCSDASHHRRRGAGRRVREGAAAESDRGKPAGSTHVPAPRGRPEPEPRPPT